MKLQKFKKIKVNYLALAFAIPCVGMLFVMLISGYEPFGKYSMLYSDMYHQYYPFFKAFRQALLSGESLLYSWNVGMGMDYVGLFSYYLASPLNLLSILVPEGWLLEFFSLLVPIKLGLAGLFFAIFLKKLFGKYDFSISFFGALYGLCAWALGYQWNVMWLDTFALLPLVALGTIALLKEKKFFLYTLTLFLSIYANYYIGLFTCIFVFLLFVCYQICRWEGIKKFFLDLCRIALFSVIAIGLTAFLELPTLAALQTTQSSVNNFPKGFKMNIASENTWKGLLSAMRQVAGNVNGGLEPTFKEGLPNLYCGVGTVMLAFLYLTAREIKLRDKLCSVFLLLFFMLSFILRQLDYIWHGFHFTNMIPYRFSFLFSFVLLYMAYRAWLLRRSFSIPQVVASALLYVCLILCSDERGDLVFLAYNAGFLVLYLIAMIYGKLTKPIYTDMEVTEVKALRSFNAKRRGQSAVILAGIVSLELILNLVNFGVWFPGTGVSNYPKGTESSASMIRYMKEREEDTLFYRAETTHNQTLNDGALNNYNGITTFTSSANVKVTEFMKTLGLGAKNTYNRYAYEETSPVANLFLGIKYMIERDDKDRSSAYFTDLHSYGGVHLLQNNAYLPLGFLAETELKDVDFAGGKGVFAFQNQLFSAATGITSGVWNLMPGSSLVITAADTTLLSQNNSGYCTYEGSAPSSTISYTYTVNRDGFFCIRLDLSKRNKFAVLVNGTELYNDNISLPQTLAVADVQVGDIVTVRMTCKDGEAGNMSVSAAILNEELFFKGYEILAASTLELTEFCSTYVAGDITCNRDGLLYTSIPQNGNWSVQVDGQDAGIHLVGDAMIAVELTEGEHHVEFVYRNTAFELGLKVTLLCLLIFAALVYLRYGNKKPQGKYQK